MLGNSPSDVPRKRQAAVVCLIGYHAYAVSLIVASLKSPGVMPCTARKTR